MSVAASRKRDEKAVGKKPCGNVSLRVKNGLVKECRNNLNKPIRLHGLFIALVHECINEYEMQSKTCGMRRSEVSSVGSVEAVNRIALIYWPLKPSSSQVDGVPYLLFLLFSDD